MSGAPIGEVFKVVIDGEERQYHILPRVFSSATMEALGRLTKAAVREQLSENLKTAVEIRKTDQAVYKDFMQQVTAECTKKVFTDYESALDALSTRDGMICALMLNCNECRDNRDAAIELVDACPSVLDLMGALVSAGNEALEAAKNSVTPDSEEGDESSETSPEP